MRIEVYNTLIHSGTGIIAFVRDFPFDKNHSLVEV